MGVFRSNHSFMWVMLYSEVMTAVRSSVCVKRELS